MGEGGRARAVRRERGRGPVVSGLCLRGGGGRGGEASAWAGRAQAVHGRGRGARKAWAGGKKLFDKEQ